jgi:hypothetical protein
MDGVSEVFPFSHEEDSSITDETRIGRAAEFLVQARDAEAQAMACLADVTKIQVRGPDTEPM